MANGITWRSNITTGNVSTCVMFKTPKMEPAKLKCLFKYEFYQQNGECVTAGAGPPPDISTITDHERDIS